MLRKIKLVFDFIANMGWRYTCFRLFRTFEIRLGLLKSRFPTSFKPVTGIDLPTWQQNYPPFFFIGKTIPNLKRSPNPKLKQCYHDINEGTYLFFSHLNYSLGKENDSWHINPDSGFQYDKKRHWTEIPDLSKEAGDIKYAWEKARFSFLYDIIRYDYHFEQDCSELVFNEIESFIDNNPINQGPQYKCSQEISLRILNWTFALYYYKDSVHLTAGLFTKLMNSVYGQLHHIYHNIHFSRVSVRNNHAITETLMLYLSGILFPFLPNVGKWSKQGKKWFEEEISYQVYKDGTFLQFSMNYHRVVVQLLTWAIRLSEINNIQLSPIVYERARRSLQFLDICTDSVSGKLPNYGANDGALFFRLTEDDYRVYTSQLNDLRMVLYGETSREEESIHWYGFKQSRITKVSIHGKHSFNSGGYYVLQEGTTKTFIRCGKYKDRPFQSDNLHLDIWVDGQNYLWDTGSFKYNTEEKFLRYFNGVEGHNTVTINGHDQMLKGGRFIWFYWVKEARGRWDESNSSFSFEGSFRGFRHLRAGGYVHKRNVTKDKNRLHWLVYDEIEHDRKQELTIFWHVNPQVEDRINIRCLDENGQLLEAIREEKWYSGYYGQKEASVRYSFKTRTRLFKTELSINI